MIQFHCHGQSVSLSPGQHFARPKADGFRDTPSADLQALIAEIDAGRPWREAVTERYATSRPWLHQIITAPSRTAFFDEVLPAETGPVLDIGAGWGQIARPLAAKRTVVALEPVGERLGFIRAAARQDGVERSMAFVETDFFETTFTTRFAAICAIGVLEWAGAFHSEGDPQERQRAFLRKARSELAPGGSLVLGIENRLGLKYLLGAPDDHIGVPNIACLPATLAIRKWREATGRELNSFTYSRAELDAMLRASGFTQVAFFAAFPDYKLPAHIIGFGADGRPVNDWLRREVPPLEHNGHDGTALDPVITTALPEHYRSLAAEDAAHPFVPSFFVRAS